MAALLEIKRLRHKAWLVRYHFTYRVRGLWNVFLVPKTWSQRNVIYTSRKFRKRDQVNSRPIHQNITKDNFLTCISKFLSSEGRESCNLVEFILFICAVLFGAIRVMKGRCASLICPPSLTPLVQLRDCTKPEWLMLSDISYLLRICTL